MTANVGMTFLLCCCCERTCKRGLMRRRPAAEARVRARRWSPRPGSRRCGRRPERPSLEDLRGAVAALQAHLMRSRWTVRTIVEVDVEVAVDLHPTGGIAVDLQE